MPNIAEVLHYLIETPHNLEQLAATSFAVRRLPVRIERLSAGWCRAVAFLDKE